ncbi:hypothetical protein QTG54_002644 [Skeletonema marinoi]|uniref:MYND-type domain-containing protein n=1 Tax=Skeletonema marinoi TaxID=267567 RepID=A0AAD9DG84_9STRA|nr:hypothetical protein QTG54_002644 [Skeletonema marinoi]
MSTECNEAVNTMLLCCASCGIAEVDDVKLKECADCDLVKYCSDECQIEHKSQHEEACKKRAAELRDEILFKQPDSSHLGDCPICMMPLQLHLKKSAIMSCCSTTICNGCDYGTIRGEKASLDFPCPFCRKPTRIKHEDMMKQRMKRIEANDPVAMYQEGTFQLEDGNYERAFEHFIKAAKLGDMEAHFQLSIMYNNCHGVEKDKGKAIHHLEEATIGGHPTARYYLGIYEWNNDHIERAVKHWIIAATQGFDDSIKALMEAFKRGFIYKEVLADALRAHQTAVDATKSPQREAAEKYFRNRTSAE